jgi:hypothetical protein
MSGLGEARGFVGPDPTATDQPADKADLIQRLLIGKK